jgi:hypothetical protein
VLAINDQPDGGQPFVESHRRIFKDAASLHAELLVAVPVHALPDAPGSEIGNLLAVAVRTFYAVRPAHRGHKVNADVGIGEIPCCLKEAFWEILRFIFHGKTIVSIRIWCVKYILTVITIPHFATSENKRLTFLKLRNPSNFEPKTQRFWGVSGYLAWAFAR